MTIYQGMVSPLAARTSRLIGIMALMSCVLTLWGCAPLGAPYQKIDDVPENFALVYIYRTADFAGEDVVYDVRVTGSRITTLFNGGYYPYYAKPGKAEFWARTEAKSSVKLDLKAGEVYYIKGAVEVGDLIGRPNLTVVPPQTAEREIAGCRLIKDGHDNEQKAELEDTLDGASKF